MINPTDKDYKETKLIKQGKRKMNSDFLLLAEWINTTFNVFVINIFYDTIDKTDYRPRLTIIFEYQKDELKFRNGYIGNFDKKKQIIIADKFRELVNKEIGIKSLIAKLFKNSSDLKYDTDNLLVVFASFEPIAKDEANSRVPENEIQKLKIKLGLSDLWEIYRQFSSTTFFFYTETQIEEYSKNGTKEELSKIYFNLLRKYDEFGYFNNETFSIALDSKENFDKKYESNWFYYSR